MVATVDTDAADLAVDEPGRRRRRRWVVPGVAVLLVTAGVGVLLKDWRGRRRRSQLDLAHDAGVSPRHLSFVETGRSRPSPELVLTLAEHLEKADRLPHVVEDPAREDDVVARMRRVEVSVFLKGTDPTLAKLTGFLEQTTTQAPLPAGVGSQMGPGPQTGPQPAPQPAPQTEPTR